MAAELEAAALHSPRLRSDGHGAAPDEHAGGVRVLLGYGATRDANSAMVSTVCARVPLPRPCMAWHSVQKNAEHSVQ